MAIRLPAIPRVQTRKEPASRLSREGLSEATKSSISEGTEGVDLAVLPNVPAALIPEGLGKAQLWPRHGKDMRKLEKIHKSPSSCSSSEGKERPSRPSASKVALLTSESPLKASSRRPRHPSSVANTRSLASLRSVSVTAKRGTFLSYLLEKSLSFSEKKRKGTPYSSRQFQPQQSLAALYLSKPSPAVKLPQADKDGIVSYSGDYHDGSRSGEGEGVYRNGDTYKGSWNHGKRDGYGEYSYKRLGTVYKGDWRQGLRHGSGAVVFQNGDTVETLWSEDQSVPGKGTIRYTSPLSAIYIGDITAASKHGEGQISYISGSSYRGLWDSDKRHGFGVLQFPNENVYEGKFDQDSASCPGLLQVKHALALKHGLESASCRLGSVWSKEEKEKKLGNLDDFYHFSTHCRIEASDMVWRSLTAAELTHKLGPLENAENGHFQGGQLTGSGIALYGEFGLYIGQFREGKRSGYGHMTYTNEDQECMHLGEAEGVYVGQWRQDLRHGKGKMTWKSGEIYEGQYRKDKRHNVQGSLLLPSGERFSGLWVHGAIQGQGRYQDPAGLLFVGKFMNGFPHTDGLLAFPNGDRFEGTIKDLKPHGHGRLQYINKDVYTGDFCEGARHGTGKMTYSDGSVYSGEWKDGSREGWGTLQTSGELYEGSWSRDMKHGVGVLKSLAGTVVFEGMWRDNVKEGRGTHLGS